MGQKDTESGGQEVQQQEVLTLKKFEEACEAVSRVTLDTELIYSEI